MKGSLAGIIASLACLLMLSGFLVVLLSVMNAKSFSASELWKMPIALPLLAAGCMLLRWLDKKGEQ